jgi:ABC-type antimicrobial peptide transport system permease subunit
VNFSAAEFSILLPAFILAEATLSYVGLGFPEDTATWGTMLREAANISAMTRFPWMLTPAAAICHRTYLHYYSNKLPKPLDIWPRGRLTWPRDWRVWARSSLR